MRAMTAYANVVKRLRTQSVQVVLRSTNFKYLQIAVNNLSPEYIALEEKIKKEIKSKIKRGKIEVYIFLRGNAGKNISINEAAVADYVALAKKISKKLGIKNEVALKDLLALPQVVYTPYIAGQADRLILDAARQGIAKLVEFKKKEGRVIEREIKKNLARLKQNALSIKKNKPLPVAEEVLRQDIDEEISLIIFYLNKLEKSLSARNAASQGKTIDFLTQELLRELNAASSKTKKKMLASMIVESKSFLERIREQAQNIE